MVFLYVYNESEMFGNGQMYWVIHIEWRKGKTRVKYFKKFYSMILNIRAHRSHGGQAGTNFAIVKIETPVFIADSGSTANIRL